MGTRTIPRRRSRLSSSSIQPDQRWRPSPLLAVVIVGLVVGLVVGVERRHAGGGSVLEDRYMALTGQLYSQGVPAAQIRDRLEALGYTSPFDTVSQSADRLASASDPASQAEAEQLRRLASALAASAGGVADVEPTAVAAPIATVTIADTAVPTPTLVPTVAPTLEPTLAPPVPTAVAVVSTALTVVPVTTVVPPPPPLPTDSPPTPTVAPPAPTATTVPAVATAPRTASKTGSIQTADKQPAIIRKQPTQKAGIVAQVPFGTKITILGLQPGEAIDPVQPNWYHVQYKGFEGYIYFKLVKPTE